MVSVLLVGLCVATLPLWSLLRWLASRRACRGKCQMLHASSSLWNCLWSPHCYSLSPGQELTLQTHTHTHIHKDTTQEPWLLLVNSVINAFVVILTSCEAVCEGIGLSLIVDGVDGHGVLCQRRQVTKQLRGNSTHFNLAREIKRFIQLNTTCIPLM